MCPCCFRDHIEDITLLKSCLKFQFYSFKLLYFTYAITLPQCMHPCINPPPLCALSWIHSGSETLHRTCDPLSTYSSNPNFFQLLIQLLTLMNLKTKQYRSCRDCRCLCSFLTVLYLFMSDHIHNCGR